MSTEPQNTTDISDKGWNDLIDQPDVVKELGKEYDSIDGRWSVAHILTRLFVLKGRADEVPDEHSEYLQTDAEDGSSAGDQAEADEDEGDDTETQVVEDDEEHDATDQFDPDRSDATEGTLQPTGFKCIIEQEPLETFLDHISRMVDEAKFRFKTDTLSVRAVDAANVGMVDTNLKSSAFDSYDVPEDFLIGLNIERVLTIVKSADVGTLIQLDYDHQTRKLTIRYGGHEWNLATTDPDSIRQEPDIPDLDLPVSATMQARLLDQAVSFADAVSDHIGFGFRPASSERQNTFYVHAEGDTDDYEGEWTDEDDDFDFNNYPGDQVESLFSLDYLTPIMKSFSATRTVTLVFGQEFPMRLNAPIMDADDEHRLGNVQYMLAPRIQSD